MFELGVALSLLWLVAAVAVLQWRINRIKQQIKEDIKPTLNALEYALNNEASSWGEQRVELELHARALDRIIDRLGELTNEKKEG
jgi:hypothetical protein